MLKNEDYQILSTLSLEGGLSVRHIGNYCAAYSMLTPRQRAQWIAGCLVHMEKEALVKRLDGNKPIAWVLTEAGAEALRTRDRATDE